MVVIHVSAFLLCFHDADASSKSFRIARAVLRELPGAKAGEALTQATAKHAKRSPCEKETDVLFGACGCGMALRYASSGHG